MFKIESYVTPILLSYVDKYVRDFKPADAQVSLWGGGVALHNLVLKADVLQQEVALPFTLVSGRIHELLIQVPWTKIMSEPIVVTIDTIECVLSLNPPVTSDDSPPPETTSRKTQVVEAPPGYMQALVRRIVSNISLRVHHLIVKYVQDDIVLSLNVKHLAVDSTGANWEPAFADIDQNQPVIRRLVRLDDLTLCLDKADADGKIRFYQEPLLYRCQLDLRVLTRLVSANTRRASSLSVQLRSSKLAWGVTNGQLVLLMRLMRERVIIAEKQPPPTPKQPATQPSLHQNSANSAEPARSESWSEWAWSWLPTWMDKEGGAEEAPMPASPIPVFFMAYLDDVSLVFKVMETENGNRKRARGVLELSATHAAIKTSIWSPTMLRVRLGARLINLKSHGKCVCGHVDYNATRDEPTVYIKRSESENFEEPWQWPVEYFGDKVEPAEAMDEQYRATPESMHLSGTLPDGDSTKELPSPEEHSEPPIDFENEQDEFWTKMSPLLYLEYTHDRSPPFAHTNPYENPPTDFQYSDWVEECMLKFKLEPVEVQICMGLIHRCTVLKNILQELPPVPVAELPMRVLTVEECDSLNDNLPQRRIKLEARGIRVRIVPWDHSLYERPSLPPLVLDLDLPKSNVVIIGPLYPHRVCSAACQIPEDNGPLWQGVRLHVTAALGSVQVTLCSPRDSQQRPCARAELRLVLHALLNRSYFREHCKVVSYSLKINELNVCGSAARLTAAWHVPMSLVKERASLPLKHTTLAKDALEDEESVAVDATFEQLTLRGYLTSNINTHHLSLQSAKVTAFHEPKGSELKQAWLFSAPDAPVTTPYIRIAVQWCTSPVADSFDYIGVWSEPTALSMDPLFIAWLAYKPGLKPYGSEAQLMSSTSARSFGSSQYYMRRKATPPAEVYYYTHVSLTVLSLKCDLLSIDIHWAELQSRAAIVEFHIHQPLVTQSMLLSSSGRGVSRSGSGAELVHVRPRSMGSSSEPSDKKEVKQPPQQAKQVEQWWLGERLLSVHERLRSILVNAELGLVLVYVTMSSASALDCGTIRDAMERHAEAGHRVLTLSLGRMTVTSNVNTRQLWQDIRTDGPTFLAPKLNQNMTATDSFPWKMKLADVSCYTLEMSSGRDRTAGLRSTLKAQRVAVPRTVVELVTTTVTLSVVTKSLHIKLPAPKKETRKHQEMTPEEQRMRYFTAGIEFKPTTLKEFVRGPARRQKQNAEPEIKAVHPPAPETKTQEGPVVSLGFHVHADTPPVIVRLDHDQVHVVAAAIHCLSHMLSLLKRAPLSVSKHSYTSLGGSHRSLIRSVSEMDEIQTPSEETVSENRDELISIFESRSAKDTPVLLKTFFWFQWVVSRATLVVATQQVKLAFDVDDIISTVDLQTHYNQLKIKLTSASVRHYERQGSDDWTAGVLGGRVLEVREPVNAKDENHFLAVTITQAQISNLPATWKEELHPKLLEEKSAMDSMWEIYVTLAPLEAILQPTILENIVSLVHVLKPRSFCPLQKEVAQRSTTWQWPFFYLTAGGLRLLVTCDQENKTTEDTIMFVVGKVAVNPHPENPICRRAINTATEASWLNPGGNFEGRQYEILVQNVGIRSAQFKQLVFQETSEEMMKGTGGENPALKWSQPVVAPVITPILHSVDISCVLAPAFYSNGLLTSGPAVEVNLVSDCALELSITQLELLRRLTSQLVNVTESDDLGHTFDEEKHGVCPYASLLLSQDSDATIPVISEVNVTETTSEFGRSLAADSGVDTSSQKTKTYEEGVKKSVSIVFVEQTTDASEYLEVFVTMGMIELSLYVADDGSPEVIALRPPNWGKTILVPPPAQTAPKEDVKEVPKREETGSQASAGRSRSLTETAREQDAGKSHMDYYIVRPLARKSEGNLPLIHVTLHQPNLYYWKKKSQKSLQVSLFNAWVGLGMGPDAEWQSVIMSTARGPPDPITDIPPALATMKAVIPCTGMQNIINQSNTRGTICLDIERPIQIEISTDKLRRLKGISDLVEKTSHSGDSAEMVLRHSSLPALYTLRRVLLHNYMESITVQTSQFSMCGSEGTIGWDSVSLQIAAGLRPERLIARGLVTALLMAAGPPGDRRHLVLQPLMLGLELEATWEAWRRAEGGLSAREPTVRIAVEVDRLVADLRPTDLAALTRMQNTLEDVLGKTQRLPPAPTNSSETFYQKQPSCMSYSRLNQRVSVTSVESTETGDHFYKDDLRSGAFKIVNGGQLPMAYQVMLHNNTVSWRYPHPRAITRLVAFPLPGQDNEIECVLELYTPMTDRWEPHTYFKIPVSEPRELQLYVTPPDAAFAMMWRFRACTDPEPSPTPFEFNIKKFAPRTDPLLMESRTETYEPKSQSQVTAEQLSGVLRVDSYFAPRLMPRSEVVLRVSEMEIHAHNALPFLSSQATALEGYYVSRPLMKSHRVFSITARDMSAYADLGSPAGVKMLVNSHLSSDIIDCATGTMEQLVEEFRAQAGVSLVAGSNSGPRTRLATSVVRVALHVPRLRTLHSLAVDWRTALDQYILDTSPDNNVNSPMEKMNTKREVAAVTAVALEGRVSLWLHNSCASALRIGQEGTDEVVPLGSGARLAYRWRSPTSPKKLRVAIAGPTADWHWSSSIPFTTGTSRVRLEDAQCVAPTADAPGGGVYLHVTVEEIGARRQMHLSGRLVLANMLRHNLLYKVRARFPESNQWQTVCSGEMCAESVGRSVICPSDYEMVLKLKFLSHEIGWSGDIPLKECPKENVPWLVKVPTDGDLAYMSVWCRVTRGRSDGRVLATLWPLYVLHSHLPLDTDVLIVTETGTSSTELSPEVARPPPLVQSALGRGTSTHLLAPGTTSARHSLSFQYRNIECPVTREAVPLHYGVTDTSVFDKRTPVASIDEVIDSILDWLARSGLTAPTDWPYSIVTRHWPGQWQPALLQPRCDITVRYQAIRAGGGCSLEVQLCPLVLLCNAAQQPLTLRAHDAAPLCKLEPGAAISPPSAILKKPFFISVEMGRETFVSGQLEVCNGEPGRYESPPPGQVALDHAADFAIQCNQKVALLTLYYEIKYEINVLGISSTYVLINRLDTELLISAIAVPKDVNNDVTLRPKAFKVVQPTKEGSLHGTPLSRFWLHSRWRGGSPNELRAYLCVAFPAGAYPAKTPLPIELGTGPVRRPVGLVGPDDRSVPVVITQVRHDSRWLVTIAPDPCPQFIAQNRTGVSLALAQPTYYGDEPSTSVITALTECGGVRWWCAVPAGGAAHYSSRAHCARYPPPAAAPCDPPGVPFLTFAKLIDDDEPGWCPPVAITDGEQLLQLPAGITIKLRVRTYPHSTLLEFLEVDERDISASDIRRRLHGAFYSGSVDTQYDQVAGPRSAVGLERIGAESELLKTAQRFETVESELVLSPPQSLITIRNVSTTRELPLKANTGSDTTESTLRARVLSEDMDLQSKETLQSETNVCETSYTMLPDVGPDVEDTGEARFESERIRCVIAGVQIEMASTADALPLFALHLDRSALLIFTDNKKSKAILSVSDIQIDNLQYKSGQFDFAVVASTRVSPLTADRWPPLWSAFAQRDAFATRHDDARLLVKAQYEHWAVTNYRYSELTELEVRLGPLALYVEDAYVTALVKLSRQAMPQASVNYAALAIAEERALRIPLRLRLLHIHPLDLTLTLHTAVRMYIALDQSPLLLSAFKLNDMMTSAERLTHALTVHYLSAAILGAGWVVGGLELLGAPGALAARVGGATGGVRGVASAAAAALLRSLSAWAGSLARNLDLLAGDEEHARRAAAARRIPPPSFVAGLIAGITNFAINILGAVGGLAHHPLVGVAVGETESGAAALRRGLLGALTKPLSATADLVAYAGHGLLRQTGWDPAPQPRRPSYTSEARVSAGWRRDCVRWVFRLAELTALAGFEVLLDGAPLQLLLTHKFLVVADLESERIVEMIDLRYCTLGPYQGSIIELIVTQRRQSKLPETRVLDDDDEYQISAAAMARVARYTGAEGAPAAGESRTLALLPAPRRALALHAALAAAIRHNAATHFSII